MSSFTVLLALCAVAAAAPSEHLQHIPVEGYHPKIQLLGQHIDLHHLPTKVIRVTKTIAIKVPVPYPVKIPHNVPYPVHVNKPYPVPVTKIIKVPQPIPVPVHSSSQHGLSSLGQQEIGGHGSFGGGFDSGAGYGGGSGSGYIGGSAGGFDGSSGQQSYHVDENQYDSGNGGHFGGSGGYEQHEGESKQVDYPLARAAYNYQPVAQSAEIQYMQHGNQDSEISKTEMVQTQHVEGHQPDGSPSYRVQHVYQVEEREQSMPQYPYAGY